MPEGHPDLQNLDPLHGSTDSGAARPSSAEAPFELPSPSWPRLAVEPDDARPSRTPPSPVLVPAAELARRPEHDLMAPEYYFNREITWLNFNYRVLHEAEDERTPLLERVKFLAIVGSNLD
jgi:polyphosphate kinase